MFAINNVLRRVVHDHELLLLVLLVVACIVAVVDVVVLSVLMYTRTSILCAFVYLATGRVQPRRLLQPRTCVCLFFRGEDHAHTAALRFIRQPAVARVVIVAADLTVVLVLSRRRLTASVGMMVHIIANEPIFACIHRETKTVAALGMKNACAHISETFFFVHC